MTLPLVALLFLPALFGFSAIFPWARGEYFTRIPSPHKQHYLTEGWFLLRTALYFARPDPGRLPAARLLPRRASGKVSRLDAAIRGGIGGARRGGLCLLHDLRLDRLGHVAGAAMVLHHLRDHLHGQPVPRHARALGPDRDALFRALRRAPDAR